MNAVTAPQFHPDQFLLQDYAAGDVPGAVALTLAVHLEYCPRCRADTQHLHGVGACLFEELDPIPVSEDAFAHLLKRLDGEAAASAAPKPVPSDRPAGLPRALSTLIPDGLEALAWSRVGRLRSTRLAFGDHRREVALQHIRAGGRVLEHDHRGTEITVVLKGRFSDADGMYQPGDYLVRGPGEVHRPVAAEDVDCLCLAVLDAPLRFNGLLGRIANPFMRIHPR